MTEYEDALADGGVVDAPDTTELTREEITRRYLYLTMQGLTIEHYEKAKAYLEGLSDDDFYGLMQDVKSLQRQRAPVSPKEFLRMLRELQTRAHVTPENTALWCMNVEFLPDEENEKLWDDINLSRPSDHVFLKTKDDEAICGLWKKGCSLEQGAIPSDLFFAGRVPLLDFIITVDETDQPDGRVCECRVVTFPDYQERIKEAHGDPVTVAAIVEASYVGSIFITTIKVAEGMDELFFGEFGYHNMPKGLLEAYKKELPVKVAAGLARAYLATWYGIQVALLHPTVREVFHNPSILPIVEPEQQIHKTGKKKRPIRYIRRHVIEAADIRAALTGGTSRECVRQTLVWYVIGHWRHYKNGRVVFIQPYWKGALRHLKMGLDCREREIVI